MTLEPLAIPYYPGQTVDQHETALFNTLQAIKTSVMTIPDHPDPNAVVSCWDFLESDIRALYNTIRQGNLLEITNPTGQ